MICKYCHGRELETFWEKEKAMCNNCRMDLLETNIKFLKEHANDVWLSAETIVEMYGIDNSIFKEYPVKEYVDLINVNLDKIKDSLMSM